MAVPANVTSSRLMAWVVLATAAFALYGCGESGSDGAEQLAKQEELRAAREEAAQDARQSAKIADLERKLKAERRHTEPAVESPPVQPVTEGQEGTEEPLVGLWKGEAVISYDSGESDPFNETIEINSLVPGELAGYAEAHQGSTTCHGPLTYQGMSEGWYGFAAEERNVAECIDYSQVELRLDAAGRLEYRETTDVSVSTGTLERVR
jgi:hypothetical protein